MSQTDATVFLIDDDASVRTAFQRLIKSAGLKVVAFASLPDFLNVATTVTKACVVADVRMAGASGLELPRLLKLKGCHYPVIFMTAHDTEETRRMAREAGAAACFRKPVDDQALLDAIRWGLDSTNCEKD